MLVVFIAQVALTWVDPAMAEAWLTRLALVPKRWIQEWQRWIGWGPVFSAAFLHGGPMHLAGNAWFLWVFGRSLEEEMGGWRFLLVYAVGTVGAALAQIAAAPGSEIPMVGASGAISAVMGAYLLRLPTRWIVSLVPWVVPILPVPAVVFLVVWFVLQLSQGMDTLGAQPAGGVAWWAHAGGFVTGALVAWALPSASGRKKKTPRGKRKASRAKG